MLLLCRYINVESLGVSQVFEIPIQMRGATFGKSRLNARFCTVLERLLPVTDMSSTSHFPCTGLEKLRLTLGL